MNIKSFFQSSQDPAQISLRVESAVKVVSTIITTIALLYGVDATPLIVNIKQFVDEILLAGSTLYGAYHTSQLIWGYVRSFAPVKTVGNPIVVTSTN